MSDKFLAFVAERRAKIIKQKQKLDSELAELDRSEKLYRASGAAATEAVSRDTAPIGIGAVSRGQVDLLAEALRDRRDGRDGTIQDRIIGILAVNPAGMTSGQILEALRNGGTPTLARTSLSPQLSRLRSAQKVDLVDGVWKLKNTEPEATPSRPRL